MSTIRTPNQPVVTTSTPRSATGQGQLVDVNEIAGGVRGMLTQLTAMNGQVAGGVRPDIFGQRPVGPGGGCFPPSRPLPDMSALVSLWGLDQSRGPISGDQLAAAIEAGVQDLDGKAATEEFGMFADWARKNEGRLSPEAKEVMGIYRKYAQSARAQGQGGIPMGEFRQMMREMNAVKDASATAALAQLDKTEGPINGDQMAAAIRKGVADADGKGSTDEYKQFADWAKKNQGRLSPEAKEVLGIYEKHAKGAQARGQSGLPDAEFRQMMREMNAVKDASATAALADLDKTWGPINGDQMAAAIRKGVADADGKGSTDEYKQFADWAKKNQDRLSPEAQEVMAIYEKHAKGAQAQGQSGLPDGDFRQMVREMNAVKDASATRALRDLSLTPGRISGRQMLDAIRKGVADADGKSATDEYKQFADWARDNTHKLSPAAREVMGIYEKYARGARAKGNSGIELGDYRRMLREMSHATRPMLSLLARKIAV